MTKAVLIQGATGQLGRVVLAAVRSRNWTAIGTGFGTSPESDYFVEVTANQTLEEQYQSLASCIAKLPHGKVDAILCMSGGFAAGNAASPDLFSSYSRMFDSSVGASMVAAKAAAELMKPGGLLVLPGSIAATNATPWGISYGASKAAVHHIVRSLASKGSGIQGTVVGIAPIILDTEMNRRDMPDADRDTWTPLEQVADRLCDWVDGEVCKSGQIYKIVTKGGMTDWIGF